MNSITEIDSPTSMLTPNDVLELFRSQYGEMPRHEACEELDIDHPRLCDFLGGRKNVHRCRKVLDRLGLVSVEMFVRKKA